MSLTPELYELIVKVVEDKVRDIRVAREEYEKLVAAVRELAEAQGRTEERLNELAIAQKRTEERLNALAEAQRMTEERLNALAEAQRRTEESLKELAEAQGRTEKAIAELSRAVGALSDIIGFGLEDIARALLPSWLSERLGVKVRALDRAFFRTPEGLIEINLYGEGERDGARAVVLGEVASKIRAADVRRFLRKLSLVEPMLPEGVEAVRVMFGFYIHPSAMEEAEAEHVHLVASYMGPTRVFGTGEEKG